MPQFGQKGGGSTFFQKCLKFKNVPKVGGGEGSPLIGTLSQIFSIFYFDASHKICCMNGTYLVHSVLMAVHSNFLAEVLATVPFHVQHMFILPDFSIDDIKTLCSVMYGSEKTGYVDC